jgi:hypothetical protein
LFAAKEFGTGEMVAFYAGNVVFTYGKKFTGMASDEYLRHHGAFLEDDTRTMTMVDKRGYRVLMNPLYDSNKQKLTKTPLLMGSHFLNDFTEIYDSHTKESLKEKSRKGNNVWVDDQGGIKAGRRILVGEEMFLSYNGSRKPHGADKKRTRSAGTDEEEDQEDKKLPAKKTSPKKTRSEKG